MNKKSNAAKSKCESVKGKPDVPPGARVYMRSDEEMAVLDKKAADAAFKKQKKEFDRFMDSKGFYKYKTHAYVRVNRVNVLNYINLQKEQYDSKTFTVNISMMPLYIPHDYIVFGLGRRISYFLNMGNLWFDFADEEAAEKSFNSVKSAIEQYVIPWFDQYNDNEVLRAELSERVVKGFMPRLDQPWLDAIDSYNSSDGIIKDNIKRLKLPVKMFND